MATEAPTKFHLVLKDPDSEQRRYVTISRVTCPKCGNDPVLRGGYKVGPNYTVSVPPCPECDGRGDVPATKDSAAAHLEALEAEYVRFRLDDPQTIAHYPMLAGDSHDLVHETTVFVPEDTHTVDRFIRARKVIPSGAPGLQREHKGWRAFHEQEKPYKVMTVGRATEKLVVTGGQFGVPQKNMWGGTNLIDWDTDTIKTALSTSTYVPDIDLHDFFNDVTNELATAGNYTAGGWTLTASAPAYDTATDQIRLDAADVSQASATFTARIATTYKSTGTSTTSPLICFLNFGADVSPSAGTFSIVWDATGVLLWDIT